MVREDTKSTRPQTGAADLGYHPADASEWVDPDPRDVQDALDSRSIHNWGEHYVSMMDDGAVAVFPQGGVRTVTAGLTLNSTHRVVLCNGTFTVTLPPIATHVDQEYWIKNIGTGTITIDGNAAETIDNALTLVVPIRYDSPHIVADSAGWWKT